MSGLFDDLMPPPAGQAPIAAQPLPNVPGYVSDPSYTAPAGSEGGPFAQAPAIPIGGPGQSAPAPAGGLFDDMAPSHEAPQPALGPDPASQISGFMANMNRGSGVGDELAAGAGVVGDLLTGHARFGADKPGNVLLNNVKMLADTFGLEMAKQRAQEDSFSAAHPSIAAMARGTGMAAPLLFSGGAAAPELATSRIGAIAKGAGAGGLAAYGYAAADRGSPMDRIEAANRAILPGMALGGVFGTIAPVAPKIAEGAPTLADHIAVGVDPMAAVNGSPDLQRIGQIVKGLPLAGSPLVKAAARTSAQLDAGVQRIGQGLGAAESQLESGIALQKGASGAVGRYQGNISSLYEPVNALEAKQQPIPVANTQRAISGMFATYPNIPDWLRKQAPALMQVHEALSGANGQLSFAELKAMRGDVGKMLDNRQTLGGVDQARLKQVYGAMSDDLMAGAGHLGGPEAQQALARADTYNAAVHTRVEDTLDKVLQAKSPEDAYGKVVAMAGSTARGDLQVLGRLKRSFDPDAWNEFASGVVHELGRDPSGNFSPAKFATAWNKLRPEARQALFGDQASDLEAAARIAGMQTAAGKFYNHSGSGSHMLTGLLLAGPVEEAAKAVVHGNAAEAVGSLAGSAAIAALGNGAARLLASPGIGKAMLAAQASPAAASQVMEAYAASNPSVAALARRFGAQLQHGLAGGVAAVGASVPSQQPK